MFSYFARICLGLAAFVTIAGFGKVAAQESAESEQLPNGAIGLEIYAERCANCHGPQGMGDGELAPNSAVPPAVLAGEEFQRRAVPALMFETISNGIMGDAGPLMPAFGGASSNPIPEQNRLDLIAAIYSLGTPLENIEAGAGLYEENCLACHGEDGSEAFDLREPAYWASQSNQNLFEALQDQTILEHNYELASDQLWRLVDYVRTFGYAYSDPLEAQRPIPAGSIFGVITNGTLGEPLTEPISVTLSAFTPDFQPAFTETVTPDNDGGFRFAVSDVTPELVYVVTLFYDGVQFGSDFGRLSRTEPAIEMPVTVYQATTDPTGVAIDQLHIVLEFSDEQLVVSELYQFGNDALTVYTGPQGNAAEGTIEIFLPEGAINPEFSHTLGSLENLLPTDDVIAHGEGCADTLPVRPGPNSLNLLVRYSLPYEDALDLAHPVNYRVANVNLVMADAGVNLENEGAWIDSGLQPMGDETFLTFAQSAIPAGEDLEIPLRGRPQLAATLGGLPAPEPNGASELLFRLAPEEFLRKYGGPSIEFGFSVDHDDDTFERAAPQ